MVYKTALEMVLFPLSSYDIISKYIFQQLHNGAKEKDGFRPEQGARRKKLDSNGN